MLYACVKSAGDIQFSQRRHQVILDRENSANLVNGLVKNSLWLLCWSSSSDSHHIVLILAGALECVPNLCDGACARPLEPLHLAGVSHSLPKRIEHAIRKVRS